jgi:Cu-Zn family superoxide dismutase
MASRAFSRFSGAAAALAAAASAAFAAPAKSAVCILTAPPGGSSGVSGTVTFYQREGDAHVTIRVRAQGVAPGKHGLHIHALGDLTQGCISAGGAL